MKSRLASLLVVACAVALTWGVEPAAAQESPQTVKAAIPPQERPTVIGQRPELAPAPKGAFAAEAANVRVEVTISYQVGNGVPVKRSATLTVADQGSGSLRSGNQVAVPSTTSYAPSTTAKGDSAILAPPIPTTSFNYRSVGLNVDARNVYIQGNRARLNLSVEFSAIDEKTADSAGRPPSFPTFSQNLALVLESGKPIIVGQSSDFVDNVERKQSVEVKATILR